MASSVAYLCFSLSCLLLFTLVECDGTLFFNRTIFSTKTPYFWSKDMGEIIEEDSGTFFEEGGKSCQAFHINSVIRHGIRYPQKKWIKKMQKLHEKLKPKKPDADYKFVDTFPEKKEGFLAKVGEKEQYTLGRRFGTRFKLLFEEDMDNIEYFVSSKQRAIESSRYFYLGLSEKIAHEDADIEEHNSQVTDDIMLRFHDNCNKYSHSVEKNKTAMGEYHKFLDGKEMKEVTIAVSKRIGDQEDFLTTGEVVILQQICIFELAFHGSSDWCQYFTEDELKTVEYLFDLKQYWMKVHGYEINWSMSCPLVSHAFNEMDKAIKLYNNENEYKVGIFRHGHAETVAPLFALLGLFNDTERPRADNYKAQEKRLFKSSNLMQFSMNIAFVLYECDDEEDKNDVDDVFSNVFVRTLVNEEPVVMPACGDTLCHYKTMRDQLSNHIDSCNFHHLCNVHDEL